MKMKVIVGAIGTHGGTFVLVPDNSMEVANLRAIIEKTECLKWDSRYGQFAASKQVVIPPKVVTVGKLKTGDVIE